MKLCRDRNFLEIKFIKNIKLTRNYCQMHLTNSIDSLKIENEVIQN